MLRPGSWDYVSPNRNCHTAPPVTVTHDCRPRHLSDPRVRAPALLGRLQRCAPGIPPHVAPAQDVLVFAPPRPEADGCLPVPAAIREPLVGYKELLTNQRDRIAELDRKSTRLNSSHLGISYAVFCLKKKI